MQNKLSLQDLADFAKRQEEVIKERYSHLNIDEAKKILAYMVKLSEEVGELSEQVLHFNSFQRKDKEKPTVDKLEEEIADVLISTSVLAQSMNIDIEKAISKRIESIKSRDKKLSS